MIIIIIYFVHKFFSTYNNYFKLIYCFFPETVKQTIILYLCRWNLGLSLSANFGIFVLLFYPLCVY